MRTKTLIACLCLAACATPRPGQAPPAAKLATITIGQSTRADVFAALGTPARTERASNGETWTYETREAGHGPLLQGASAASAIAGAFIPFAGLAGPGLGLADVATPGHPTAETTVAIRYGPDGRVRDCAISSTAPPSGVPGGPADAAPVQGCQPAVKRPITPSATRP